MAHGNGDRPNRVARSSKEANPQGIAVSCPICYADAVGYLWGWGKEVKKEVDNGTFTRENEGKRIQAGMNEAEEASFGWLVGFIKQ